MNQGHYPPGKIKIVTAMRTLLGTKDFSSIKIAEIAKTAGVTEPLIYKYFKDKRDVLYVLLQNYLETSFISIEEELEKINGSLNKLKHFIFTYIQAYDTDRVIARIILLEVSNTYDYYKSESYHLLKKHGKLVYDIIKKGVKDNEIRDDVHPMTIRHLFFGTIDRSCLGSIIFNKPLNVKSVVDETSKLIFDAISKK